jgi:hypothetical protein
VTLSISRGQLVAERRAQRATAALGSDSGIVKPIELSDEAWKIVETDSRSASTAANVARRDAVHADHALASDGDDRLAAHDRERLDRVASARAPRRDFRCRRSWGRGTSARADRMRVPAIGISARGCSTFAP